jgi:hypothetical protein
MIENLITIPQNIYEAELHVITLIGQLQEKKEALVNKETELLLNGAIDGKNAEIRNAQLREKTKDERETVKKAEEELNKAKATLTLWNNRYRAARTTVFFLSSQNMLESA